MKNVIKHLLLFAVTICLTSSFVDKPVPSPVKIDTGSFTHMSVAGGAFLVFAGKHGGEIKKDELTSQRELKVDGCAKGSKIFSYSLEVNKRGMKSTLEAKSNLLSDEMITKLKSLSPGDSFEFKSMKAYLPNGKDIVDVHGQKFVVVS